MNLIGTINSRNIFYQKYDPMINWGRNLTQENWLAVAIVDTAESFKLNDISKFLIDNNACFICCAGASSELLHDIVDDEIIVRAIDNSYKTSLDLVTTWHHDIEEAFWFAIFVANNNPRSIDSIVCIDSGKNGSEQELLHLLRKFKDGYIPPL